MREHEQTFRDRDKNHDGVLTLEEYGGHPGNFSAMDANGDRVLSRDEFVNRYREGGETRCPTCFPREQTERTEFEPAMLSRCTAVVADSVPQVKNLSSELMQYYGRDESKWRAVRPLSAVVAEGKGRPAGADLTLFKAMGMGISDLALGIEILRRAGEQRLGREFPHPQPAKLFA